MTGNLNWRNKTISNKKAKEITGTYIGSQRGYGFVRPADTDGRDIYIQEGNAKNAFHGDTVEVILLSKGTSGDHEEGRITRITKRASDRLVGIYKTNGRKGFFYPDDSHYSKMLNIKRENSGNASNGCKVVARITDYGSRGKDPEGIIEEVLGHVNDPGVDILSIVKSYNLPESFDDRLLHLAKQEDKAVRTADMEGRKDLRGLPVITIDDESAKDLDDGVSLTMKDGIYSLGVHIADVSHYVKERSLLDKEARTRGTSVYLADRVIPMLPQALSNGICSLKEHENRLTLSCLMKIDKTGRVTDYDITESVISVKHRMTYKQVDAILEGSSDSGLKGFSDVSDMIHIMAELSGILRNRRGARGSLDFDLPETRVVLNKKGKPVDILPYERKAASKLIEDFMLLANETVAEHFYWQEIPFLYRIHEKPDPEKIQALNQMLARYGHTLHYENGDVHPGELQKLLHDIEGTPEEDIIRHMTLRSMRQARYSAENTGHFGLAARYYCHFTSPIRRYPDLLIHRIIKESLSGKLDDRRRSHYQRLLPGAADELSRLERRADDAERETTKMKVAEYMKNHIGDVYNGVISGVTGWGFYVVLSNTAEGLVHVRRLNDDFYEYKEETHELVGERTGRAFHLGDPVRIIVSDADKVTRTVDFDIYEE